MNISQRFVSCTSLSHSVTPITSISSFTTSINLSPASSFLFSWRVDSPPSSSSSPPSTQAILLKRTRARYLLILYISCTDDIFYTLIEFRLKSGLKLGLPGFSQHLS
ncbi:hypothetical protein E2C01_062745 [Portunus trituberculatus]|uniref:Uncharacterized protein n=1 Tax=Portunus trituberculatus TaxID=210409 RepID=A0A5B7HEJ6_PORTR|nr:hypothetical protein [Portunus trituberculatus]